MNSSDFNRRGLLLGGVALGLIGARPAFASDTEKAFANSPFRKLTDADWRKRLPNASETPWTSPLLKEHRKGTFVCLGCELPLFRSEWKFESGTGWPSFFRAFDANIGEKGDFSIGIPRTEYHCARCLGHQGHLFNDGPQPTGLRYCNNGVALKFKPG
jgi:peptide-methionine (R)-S-oxide reductase